MLNTAVYEEIKQKLVMIKCSSFFMLVNSCTRDKKLVSTGSAGVRLRTSSRGLCYSGIDRGSTDPTYVHGLDHTECTRDAYRTTTNITRFKII